MRRLTLLTALGASLAAAAPAFAADLTPRLPYAEPPAAGPAVAELGSGWYIRGDLGYSDFEKPGDKPYSTVAVVPFDKERLKGTGAAGGGIGYKFTNWLRADVTADYRLGSDFDALSSKTRYVEGFSRDTAKMQASTLLFNAYFDLGTWYGVTPYVGAGVGVAQNRFHGYAAQVTCITPTCGDTSGATYALGPQPKSFVPSGTRTNLAWALMAGASMQVLPGVLVDAGYRFVNLGEARTKLDQFGVGTRTTDLHAHEIRVGVRYMID
jgi:opacity protein-like surface antigen